MKTIRGFNCFIFTILLLISFKSNCQSSDAIDSLKIKLIIAAREIMASSETCALITLDKEGVARVRTMNPFDPENDLTVWFGTNPNSRKVNQIKNDPRVTLYYLDKDETGYVTIHGTAQIINDQKEKEKWWKDEWKDYYPNKNDDYLLIKVIPKWMEVISETRKIFGDTITWQPKQILFETKK